MMTGEVPGQLLIRIEAIAACCCPGHFLLQPAPELSDATKHRDGVIQRHSGAPVSEAGVAHLDVLVSALDGQGAATVSLNYKMTLSVLCRRVMIDNYAVGRGCGAHSTKLAIHQALLGALLCAADGELSLLEDVGRRLRILAVISTGPCGSPAIGIGRSHSCFKMSMSDNF